MDTTQFKYHEYKFDTIDDTKGMVLFFKVLPGFIGDTNEILVEKRKRYPDSIKCLFYFVVNQTLKAIGDYGIMISFAEAIKSPNIVWKDWNPLDLNKL